MADYDLRFDSATGAYGAAGGGGSPTCIFIAKKTGGNQTIAGSGNDKITFETPVFQVGSAYTGGATSTFTCPATGYYYF